MEDEFSLLEQEFRNTTKDLVNDMRGQLPALTDQPDPDDIIYKNIDRANKILDKIEEQLLAHNELSNCARLIEVCAQLINSVTAASTSISGNSFNRQKHEYNMKIADIKEQEVEVKRIVAGTKAANMIEGGGGEKQEKVLVMDRETLLKMMEDEKSGVHVKSYQ